MEGEALVDTLSETLSEVVAKTIAGTLTCEKTEAPLKTEGDTLAGMAAYTVVDTVEEVAIETPV